MSTQDYIILTASQKAQAEALNDSTGRVDPRALDNSLISLRVGINLNPSAVGVVVGATVSLTAKYVVPLRHIGSPENARWVTMFSGMPVASLDSDTVFAPVVPD